MVSLVASSIVSLRVEDLSENRDFWWETTGSPSLRNELCLFEIV